MKTPSQYDKQAEAFLKRFGITFKAVLSGTKAPPWEEGCLHGHHYIVTLSKGGAPCVPRSEVSFDFWGSKKDREDGVRELTAYSVLACISGDITCPDSFSEFCAEYGHDADSRKAEGTFRRCAAFAKRLRAFFTDEEIEQLQEIQ